MPEKLKELICPFCKFTFESEDVGNTPLYDKEFECTLHCPHCANPIVMHIWYIKDDIIHRDDYFFKLLKDKPVLIKSEEPLQEKLSWTNYINSIEAKKKEFNKRRNKYKNL